ncbi:DoxX family protein [Singulisphaera sp. PoT]|uniref:DoxX family protein n=1 Tax=Singulisphaera sp. PoT TaxID=3411797 RepID=UPI003BF466FE
MRNILRGQAFKYNCSTRQVSEGFLRFIALVDFAGGIGILLPAATRILRGLGVLAAFGCTVVQILAIGFHASRGELASTPFNFFLLALCVFVTWGRYKWPYGAIEK